MTKRSDAKRNFDWTIKGWAFMDSAGIKGQIAVGEKALEAITNPAERQAAENTLAFMRQEAQ